jgi:hypothetical protein
LSKKGQEFFKPIYVREAMVTQLNIETRSRYHCWLRKSVSISYSECTSVALVVQQAKRIHLIAISLALPYFSTLCHRRHDIRENIIEHKTRVLVLCH